MELTSNDLVGVRGLVELLNDSASPSDNDITVDNVEVWSSSGDRLGAVTYSSNAGEYVFEPCT